MLGTYVYGMKIDVAGIVIWTILLVGAGVWMFRYERGTRRLGLQDRIAELERDLGLKSPPD